MIPETTVPVAIELCRNGAVIPEYSHPHDGGMDITAPLEVIIPAGATRIVLCGFKVAVPEGWMLLVFPRSGLSAKSGLRIANSPGLIDAGYRDEVGVIIHNTGSEDYLVSAGARIAQLVLMPRFAVDFQQAASVADIGEDRGGGFGHSG